MQTCVDTLNVHCVFTSLHAVTTESPTYMQSYDAATQATETNSPLWHDITVASHLALVLAPMPKR